MLIDGVIKRFPTATVEIDTPFYKGCAKVLCMDNPVQEVIIGNIPGAVGLRQHSDNGVKSTKLCTDELRQCSDRSVEVADQCTGELKQQSDDILIATDQ